jgi:putative transposase
MGSVGDCFDNAVTESFFATLACELRSRQPLATRAAARLAIFEYVQTYDNPRRQHSALGYHSPLEHERRYHQQQAEPPAA